MATHSSILAWRIPLDGGVWPATVCGVTKSLIELSTQWTRDYCTVGRDLEFGKLCRKSDSITGR
ncbi:hypothetical protein, partial [Klebsiella pneumoniae]|uniref:hypothetical protein n=1 Tax=Klebsiella pneumoniae TaxID=573 RepID=UPI0030087409